MGAWDFVSPRAAAVLSRRGLRLRYVGRAERASPSEGTPQWHATEQSRILAAAFAGVLRGAGAVDAAPAPPETARALAGAGRATA